MQALKYAIDKSLKSLWRGRRSGRLSTVTTAVALFVLGAFLLVTANLDRLGAEWSSAAELSVYLSDHITADERRVVESTLQPGDIDAGRIYVSKAEAVAHFKQTFGDLSAAIAELGDNPLPVSYEVRLKPDALGSPVVENLAVRLRKTPGVADVHYDLQWLSRLVSAIGIIRGVGLALGAILTVAAILAVANVVRLALYARRDELEIVQLVGAPQVYIRGPFVMEGLLQGGLGALVALSALGVEFLAVHTPFLVPLTSAVNLSSVGFLPPGQCLALVLGGMGAGSLGGLVAAWSRP